MRARQGANTPVPLERSPPASFKRLLGGSAGGCGPLEPVCGKEGAPGIEDFLRQFQGVEPLPIG